MVKSGGCEWCGEDPLYLRYHDLEWGVPTRDRAALFELLVLETNDHLTTYFRHAECSESGAKRNLVA